MATAAPAAATANKAELLAIADAVAREKLIDKAIVIEAMEDAIQRAARARYGAENDIRAKLDGETGDLIGVDGGDVRIDVKGLGDTAIPFGAIRNAKLLMTDRLIRATAPLAAGDIDETDVEIEIEEEGQD